MRTITIFHIQFELENNIAVFWRLYKDIIGDFVLSKLNNQLVNHRVTRKSIFLLHY